MSKESPSPREPLAKTLQRGSNLDSPVVRSSSTAGRLPQDPRLNSTMVRSSSTAGRLPQDPRLKSTMVRSSSLCLPEEFATAGRLPQDPRLKSSMVRSSSLCLPEEFATAGRLPQDPSLASFPRIFVEPEMTASKQGDVEESTQVVHFGDTFMQLKGKSRTSEENKKSIHDFHAYINPCDDSASLTLQTMVVCDGRFLFLCIIIVGCFLCWQCDSEWIVYFSC